MLNCLFKHIIKGTLTSKMMLMPFERMVPISKKFVERNFFTALDSEKLPLLVSKSSLNFLAFIVHPSSL